MSAFDCHFNRSKADIMDDRLADAWRKWIEQTDIDADSVGAIDFLEDYVAENWVVFELHTKGMPGDTVWVVIDMAGHEV